MVTTGETGVLIMGIVMVVLSINGIPSKELNYRKIKLLSANSTIIYQQNVAPFSPPPCFTYILLGSLFQGDYSDSEEWGKLL